MRHLWETDPKATAAVLAEKFGVTRMIVVGLAARRKWARSPVVLRNDGFTYRPPVQSEPRTLYDRLDAMHAHMDKVLEETKNIGRYTWPPAK